MNDLVIIGAGPSAYGFLKGLEKNSSFNNKKITLIYPSETKSHIGTKTVQDISPKFLQKENLLSLSYYIDSFGSYVEKGFTHIGIHGIGGMARIWGGSVGEFNKEALIKNNFNPTEFSEIYDEIKSFLPYKSKSIKISKKIKNLFGDFVNNKFKIGFPKLLIKETCNNCNQCLIGCELNSIWYPSKNDFQNIKNINISILDNSFVININGNKIEYLNNNKTKYITTRKTILAAGTFQNYKLLVNSNTLINTKAKLYTTPAISFAFLDFTKNYNKEFFGMGNATFAIKKNKKIKFYGNLYDGYSLSLSKGKVFSKLRIIDILYKLLSRFMVAGAGFLSSDNADCNIQYENKATIINGKYTDKFHESINYISNTLNQFIKERKSIKVHFEQTKIGADIHYAGGIPLELYDINKIIDGRIKNNENIIVVGGSTFSYLPPESPTLSYIANSYRIGKKLTYMDTHE